jgi:hypothetical protein
MSGMNLHHLRDSLQQIPLVPVLADCWLCRGTGRLNHEYHYTGVCPRCGGPGKDAEGEAPNELHD